MLNVLVLLINISYRDKHMQLNIEQKKLIQTKPAGHIIIRGVSRKTTVAVNRIPFLLNHYCL
jgi:hypothetical protein